VIEYTRHEMQPEPAAPIVVEVFKQPPVAPEIGMADVVVAAVGLTGVIMAGAVLAGLLAGGVIVWVKIARARSAPPPESGHARLRG